MTDKEKAIQNTGDLAPFYFHQGSSQKAYAYLGAHFCTQDEKQGVVFRVWAPNAVSVSVVGSFNNWDENASVMQKITEGGVWECFVEGVTEFDAYKYCIPPSDTREGEKIFRADPYAFHA